MKKIRIIAQLIDEDLHELIAERYEQTSTMITSNLMVKKWQQAFNNKLLGVATIDRLKQNIYLVTLDDKSYRRVQKRNNK